MTINFFLKCLFISANSLNGDEAFSVYHAQMSVPMIISELSKGNNPPLYEIFLHFWIKLFGISELSVRFPSLITSCVTLIFLYLYCARYFNRRVAVYVSLLFIFTNYNVKYAHQARVYAIMGMLSIMSVYYFTNLLQYYITRPYPNSKMKLKEVFNTSFIVLVVINTLLIYAHYFGFWVLIAELFFILLHYRILIRIWREVLVFSAVILLLYLPNIKVFFVRFAVSSVHGNLFIPKPNGVETLYNMIWTFCNQPVVAVSVMILLFAFAVSIFVSKKPEFRTDERLPARLIAFLFFFIFLSMFFISYKITMFLDRYLMPASIGFYILLGIVLDGIIENKKYRYFIPVVLIALFIVTFDPKMRDNNDMRKITEYLTKKRTQNSFVIISPFYNDLLFTYYHNRKRFQSNTDNSLSRDLLADHIHPENDVKRTQYRLYSHILYIELSVENKSNRIILEKEYSLINQFSAGTYKIYEYSRR
ncbi:MAG: glycosyltransferase family 39 protein [Bacteroidia bacterium]|nr:glycosyltransferase family 39 protein [Bacteroidia bacterium]